MNFPDLKLIPDVQSSADSRQLAIDRVGIRGLKYPMQIVDDWTVTDGGSIARSWDVSTQ